MEDQNFGRRAALATFAATGATMALSACSDGQTGGKGQRKAQRAKAKAVTRNAPPLDIAPPMPASKVRTPFDASDVEADVRARKSHLSPFAKMDASSSVAYNPGPLVDVFRWRHCDILIQQASDLLDRALRDRQEWEDKTLKAYTLLSDIEQFETLDQIHRAEEVAGYYEVDFAESQSQLNAVTKIYTRLRSAAFYASSWASRVRSNFNEQWGWIQLTGWMSHMSASGRDANDRAVVWNGVQKSIIDYSYDAAVAQGDYGLQNDADQVSANEESRLADVDSAEQRISGYQARADWDDKNRSFRRLRSEAMRRIYADKRRALVDSDGGLAFLRRTSAIEARMSADISEALARMAAVVAGLSTIYGYSISVPETVVQFTRRPSGSGASARLLDDSIQWVRQTQNWLSRFAELDNIVTSPFSLRQMLGDSGWAAFVSTGQATVTIDESYFGSQRHVRLRGISLFHGGDDAFFTGKVDVPKTSFYRHKNGKIVVAQQDDVPPLRVGSIRPWNSGRPPEIVGINAGYNVAPFGQWNISISDFGSGFHSLRRANDIFFELTSTVQEPS